MQIDLAPPSPDGETASQAITYQSPADGGLTVETPFPKALWTARLVEGGYEIEALLPWSLLGWASTPPAGTHVALDLGVNVSDHADADLELTSWYAVRGIAATTTCGGGKAIPPCDDRSWCTPWLEGETRS